MPSRMIGDRPMTSAERVARKRKKDKEKLDTAVARVAELEARVKELESEPSRVFPVLFTYESESDSV